MENLLGLLSGSKDRKSINSRVELKLKLVELSSHLGMEYELLEAKFANELSELPLTQDESTRELIDGTLPILIDGFIGALNRGKDDAETDSQHLEEILEKVSKCTGGCQCGDVKTDREE